MSDRFEKSMTDVKSAVEAYQKANGIASYELAFAEATQRDPATRDAWNELIAEREGRAPAATARPEQSEIVKSAQLAVGKAESDLRAHVAAYQRLHGLRSYELAFAKATHADPVARALYDKAEQAREDARKAPVVAAVAKISDELTKVRKALDEQTERFSIAHNLDGDSARARLTVISPSFREMSERAIQLGHELDAARTRAEAQLAR